MADTNRPAWIDLKTGEIVYAEPEEGRVVVAAGDDLTAAQRAARFAVYDLVEDVPAEAGTTEDPTGDVDPETATKRELVALVDAKGLNVDKSLKVDDLRDAVIAALATITPAEAGTTEES